MTFGDDDFIDGDANWGIWLYSVQIWREVFSKCMQFHHSMLLLFHYRAEISIPTPYPVATRPPAAAVDTASTIPSCKISHNSVLNRSMQKSILKCGHTQCLNRLAIKWNHKRRLPFPANASYASYVEADCLDVLVIFSMGIWACFE